MDLNKIADNREKRLLRIFLEVVSRIKNEARITELSQAIELQNFDSVFRILGLNPERFEPVVDEIRAAYREGGITGMQQVGRVPIPNGVGTAFIDFNMQNPSALAWLASEASRLVTEITQDQREMITEVIQEQLINGVNPRTTALDLVGRIDPTTQQRTGGFIGLTSQQAQWVRSAKEELENLDANYLTRQLRDKRFDGTVRKAIESGEKLTAKQVRSIINRLEQRTLNYRANVIARTESITALGAGQNEAMQQVLDSDYSDDVEKQWDAALDRRTRDDHLIMNEQRVKFAEPFVFPDGSRAMYPRDTSLGAPGKQTIQCRCAAVYRMQLVGAGGKIIRGFE